MASATFAAGNGLTEDLFVALSVGEMMAMTKKDDVVSLRRYSLLRGWARYLVYLPEIEKQKDAIAKLRGSHFGIAVKDDWHALRWQRLDFLTHRARYAVEMYGLKGHTRIDENGLHVSTPDEIEKMNRESFDKYRQRARRAKRILEAANLLVCQSCHNQGYYMVGDVDYPCGECQIPGIVAIAAPIVGLQVGTAQ